MTLPTSSTTFVVYLPQRTMAVSPVATPSSETSTSEGCERLRLWMMNPLLQWHYTYRLKGMKFCYEVALSC